jgi:hypothetical protein
MSQATTVCRLVEKERSPRLSEAFAVRSGGAKSKGAAWRPLNLGKQKWIIPGCRACCLRLDRLCGLLRRPVRDPERRNASQRERFCHLCSQFHVACRNPSTRSHASRSNYLASFMPPYRMVFGFLTTRGFDGSGWEERTFAKNFMKIFISCELLRFRQMFGSDKRGNILFIGI